MSSVLDQRGKGRARSVIVSIEGEDGHQLQEYRQVIATCPTLCDYIDVKWNEKAGRHMVAAKDLATKECYCEEGVLVSWPSLHDILGGAEVDKEIYALEEHQGVDADDTHEILPNGHYEKIFSDLPWNQWARWQMEKSPQAAVGVVALASCLCQLAEQTSSGVVSFADAIRPYERLCGLPANSTLAFENVTIADIYDQLHSAASIHPFDQLTLWNDRKMGEALLENFAERLSQNGIGYGGSRRGVFVLLSLCNHDCNPNSEVEYIDSTTIRLNAIREIKEGEMLTINYCPVSLDYDARKQRLKHWHFECTCERCRAEGLLLANLDTTNGTDEGMISRSEITKEDACKDARTFEPTRKRQKI